MEVFECFLWTAGSGVCDMVPNLFEAGAFCGSSPARKHDTLVIIFADADTMEIDSEMASYSGYIKDFMTDLEFNTVVMPPNVRKRHLELFLVFVWTHFDTIDNNTYDPEKVGLDVGDLNILREVSDVEEYHAFYAASEEIRCKPLRDFLRVHMPAKPQDPMDAQDLSDPFFPCITNDE